MKAYFIIGLLLVCILHLEAIARELGPGERVDIQLGSIVPPAGTSWSRSTADTTIRYEGRREHQPEVSFIILITEASIVLSSDVDAQMNQLALDYSRDFAKSINCSQPQNLKTRPAYHGYVVSFQDEVGYGYYAKVTAGHRHTLTLMGLRCSNSEFENFAASFIRDPAAFPPPRSLNESVRRVVLGFSLVLHCLTLVTAFIIALVLGKATRYSRRQLLHRTLLAALSLEYLAVLVFHNSLLPEGTLLDGALALYIGFVVFTVPSLWISHKQARVA